MPVGKKRARAPVTGQVAAEDAADASPDKQLGGDAVAADDADDGDDGKAKGPVVPDVDVSRALLPLQPLKKRSPYLFVLEDTLKSMRELLDTIGSMMEGTNFRIRYSVAKKEWFVFVLTQNVGKTSFLRVVYNPLSLVVHPSHDVTKDIEFTVDVRQLLKRIQHTYIGDKGAVSVRLRQKRNDNEELQVSIPSASVGTDRSVPLSGLPVEMDIDDIRFEFDSVFHVDVQRLCAELKYGIDVLGSEFVTIENCVHNPTNLSLLLFRQNKAETVLTFACAEKDIDAMLPNTTLKEVNTSSATTVVFDCDETSASTMADMDLNDITTVSGEQCFRSQLLLDFLSSAKATHVFLMLHADVAGLPMPCVFMQNRSWAKYLYLQGQSDPS